MCKNSTQVPIPHSMLPINAPGIAKVHVTISVDGVELKHPTEEELDEQYEPYAIELGKLIYSWNRLQVQLCELFVLVAGCDQGFIAKAIWYSTPVIYRKEKC